MDDEWARHDYNTAKDRRIHRVVRGQVECPRLGLIDVELCFYCPLLSGIDLDSPKKIIACCPPIPATPEERLACRAFGILAMASIEGNISEVCRKNRITRKQFYQAKACYAAGGLRGLISLARRKKLFQ